VFQTQEERDYYTWLKCPTAVIPNPVKEDLPAPFTGERRHEIVNFCRLNKQKNIPLLIGAFEKLLREYPDYTLRIYGRGDEKDNLVALTREKGLEDSVFFEDFASDVHDRIRDAAMYVCSSDFEGLSNSMLEAMAIGLPCVCTDCEGGGARMMIQDGKNGLLTPIGDEEALYQAMKKLADDPAFAARLGREAANVRQELSIYQIADRWETMIG
jgi:glycosyltransferase involved in cell wall biosynthesis